MTVPPIRGYSPSAAIPMVGEVLLEHFDRAPIGLFLLDGDRKIIRANEALAQLTGIGASILHDSSLRRLLSADAPDDLEDRIFDELSRANYWEGELELRTSVGVTSPMKVSITPVGSDGKGPVRYVATVIELGEQRWIEAESSRRAAELAAFASIAVATGSSSNPSEMLNAVARSIVERLEVDACWIHRYEAEHSQVTLAGEASYLSGSVRLSPGMIADSINPELLRTIETREHSAASELLDRSIATIVHAPLLAQDEVVGVISILSVEGEKLSARSSDLLRAVTYQVGTAIQNVRLLESIQEQQEELQAKNAQLELYVEELMNADRLKNEFLANTSHELRTPLNSIIGFLNLVLDGLCENEEEQRELLGHALRSGRHLLDLINDVLDLSRIEAGRIQLELREVDLGFVLAEVQSTLAVQALEKHLLFEVASPPHGLKVSADEARLRQVLMNIVGNAIKFTQRGEVRVSVDAPAGSPFVEIRVKDTGIGVPADRRERLFRKFSQADASTTRRFGGTGLGLVIVKELLEMMGGGVRLDSGGDGLGTLVTISVVRAVGQAPAVPADAPGGPATSS
ncbi:MAG TPA: ATP-binding protein [Candidatus Eisenbacteria bacterium]|nr:ATP-binding protein [Candidatus Eisenbacteria bacterium]